MPESAKAFRPPAKMDEEPEEDQEPEQESLEELESKNDQEQEKNKSEKDILTSVYILMSQEQEQNIEKDILTSVSILMSQELGHLVGWKFKFWNETSQIVKVRRSLHNRRVVAIWKRNHIVTRRYTPQDRQHSRWRRRKRKLKHRRIFKRRVLDREDLSKELYKKRKLLHQRNLQRKLQSSQQRLLAVRVTQEVDLTGASSEDLIVLPLMN